MTRLLSSSRRPVTMVMYPYLVEDRLLNLPSFWRNTSVVDHSAPSRIANCDALADFKPTVGKFVATDDDEEEEDEERASQQQIDEATSEEAFNELFINTQAAVARALGVEIQDSAQDGDNNSE